MFKRIYLYRLKAMFRDPSTLFWMLIFPYLLAIIFSIVILPVGNLKFEALKVAVVQNEALEQNPSLKSFFTSISSDSAENKLLSLEYMDEQGAVKELDAFAITGFYTALSDGTLELSLNRSSIDQTILRSIADSYNQISKVVNATIQSHPQEAEAIVNSLNWLDTQDLLRDKNYRSEGNAMVVYFFALIGMFIMYAMNFAMVEISYLQGNLSKQGARVLVSPASKGSLLLASLAAAMTIQMANSIVFIIFLDKVIGIPLLHFGLPLWTLLFIANITAMTLGTALATMVKGSMDMKIGVAISISMLCSFLAGLMTEGIRFFMINNFPFLARLNPAELIADSFYSLYFFADNARVWQNCLILAAIALVLSILSAFKLRRSDYASI